MFKEWIIIKKHCYETISVKNKNKSSPYEVIITLIRIFSRNPTPQVFKKAKEIWHQLTLYSELPNKYHPVNAIYLGVWHKNEKKWFICINKMTSVHDISFGFSINYVR